MEKNNQSQPRSGQPRVIVSFPGRHTGLGAWTRYRILDPQTGVEIERYWREKSRTGNHWTDYWKLEPGHYFVAWRLISNSGRHRCGFGRLVVSSDGYRIEEWSGPLPKGAEELLCECLEFRSFEFRSN